MSNMPPLTPEGRASKSFFHHAATISACLIPVPFVIQSATASFFQSMEHDIISVCVRLFSASLVILSFGLEIILGIVALCGIPKHGTKGILVKALFGIGVPILLIVISIPAIIHARQLAEKEASQQTDSQN